MRWKNRQLSKLKVFYLLLSFITIGCSKTDDSTNTGFIPGVTTRGLDSILMVTAVCSGTITDDKGISLKTVGICWNTDVNPTIENKIISLIPTDSIFSCKLIGLFPNTRYYVRAFATNEYGTAYGNTMILTTLSDKIQDIDGNVYNTVQIGNQIWMAENLKVQHYRNGDPIPYDTSGTNWENRTEGACCYYNNDIDNFLIYGMLYNWYAVNDDRSLAPEGWHVPTYHDWGQLLMYLGGASIAGGKLKEKGTAHWKSPNNGATNSTGFTALPGGSRPNEFINLTIYGDWWTSTINEDPNLAYFRSIMYDYSDLVDAAGYKYYGKSVRCIRD